MDIITVFRYCNKYLHTFVIGHKKELVYNFINQTALIGLWNARFSRHTHPQCSFHLLDL